MNIDIQFILNQTKFLSVTWRIGNCHFCMQGHLKLRFKGSDRPCMVVELKTI